MGGEGLPRQRAGLKGACEPLMAPGEMLRLGLRLEEIPASLWPRLQGLSLRSLFLQTFLQACERGSWMTGGS